jgi:hypothetical protein
MSRIFKTQVLFISCEASQKSDKTLHFEILPSQLETQNFHFLTSPTSTTSGSRTATSVSSTATSGSRTATFRSQDRFHRRPSVVRPSPATESLIPHLNIFRPSPKEVNIDTTESSPPQLNNYADAAGIHAMTGIHERVSAISTVNENYQLHIWY